MATGEAAQGELNGLSYAASTDHEPTHLEAADLSHDWTLRNDAVRVRVKAIGGSLEPDFRLQAGWVSPMHVAPWANERLPDEIPPMLRWLRGDFFCAPFGESDLIPEETRPHGTTANGRWSPSGPADPEGGSALTLELELEGQVMGAQVTKRVAVRQGQAIVYQEHVFHGGSGRLPVGHHAMLHASEPLLLGFSDWIWGGTPPSPLEPGGVSKLLYPQTFHDLTGVSLQTGQPVDLTRYPALKDHEDLLMLVADTRLPFAWSAATAPRAGWVWFALKNPRVLRSTILWQSNGGRKYAPFNGRHRNVIGLEEITAYFHLGHRAALENPLLEAGLETALELSERLSVRLLFGMADVPAGFGAVTRMTPVPDGVRLEDAAGLTTFAPLDLDFITVPAARAD